MDGDSLEHPESDAKCDADLNRHIDPHADLDHDAGWDEYAIGDTPCDREPYGYRQQHSLLDAVVHRDSDLDRDLHRDGYRDPDSHLHRHPDLLSQPERYDDLHADGYLHGDPHWHIDADLHHDPNSYDYEDGYPNRNSHHHQNVYLYPIEHADADEHATANQYSDGHAYADGDAHSYGQPHSDADTLGVRTDRHLLRSRRCQWLFGLQQSTMHLLVHSDSDTVLRQPGPAGV